MFDIVLSVNGQHVTVQGHFAGTPTAPHSLGSNVTLDALNTFAKAVEKAARHEEPVENEYLRFAQDLYQAFFQGDFLVELLKLPEPRQVRLLIDDLRLRKIPWEALCKPKTHEDFLAKGTTYHVVRGVTSTNSTLSSPVDGALRVLVIGPQSDRDDFDKLKATTEKSIQWLRPILGADATWRAIQLRLNNESPLPHVVHFLGHGEVQGSPRSSVQLPNVPSVRLADVDEQQEWLPVETLASALAGVPLVVLETCEGASPGEYDSAADILLRAKVDAVISYLWPVRALLSHTASKTFYEALVADKPTRGDIVAGVHAARLSILNNRASGLSMVLHVRGKASVAFDFAPAKPIGKEKPSKKPLSSFPPPAPPLEPTHTAKVIDRIHQWRPLVADCSSKKTPLLFLVHGTPHQNLKLFLDRIFEQLPRSCPRHSVVPVRRDAENTYANTEIEWKSVFLRSTGPYLADLAAFLRRETSQDHRIFVFTQDNGNPLKLDAKSTLGLISFFASVHKQLAVPTATNLYKHALRFVIPVEHSDEGVDEHVQGLVTNLESKPALECIKLDELTFPPLHEVWQCIIEELKGSEHDAVFKAKCFATYRQVEKDPHRTVQKLGDALDPVLGEWEQKRFQ